MFCMAHGYLARRRNLTLLQASFWESLISLSEGNIFSLSSLERSFFYFCDSLDDRPDLLQNKL